MSVDQIKDYSYNKYANDAEKSLEKFALNFLEKSDFNIKSYNVIEEASIEKTLEGNNFDVYTINNKKHIKQVQNMLLITKNMN